MFVIDNNHVVAQGNFLFAADHLELIYFLISHIPFFVATIVILIDKIAVQGMELLDLFKEKGLVLI